MFQNTYRIADRTVLIRSLYSEVHELCSDYRTELPPSLAADITVTVTAEHIARERQYAEAERQLENRSAVRYADSYLETLAVYRQIADQMTAFDTLLFHGSAIAVDGVGYLFTAKSGTGKSTHTTLWRELFGERAVMINDDKPLLRVSSDGVTVFGTPWDGKHRRSTNGAFPLKAICILERAAENHIERINAKEAFSMLVQQTYRPKNPAKLAEILGLLDVMTDVVGLFRLGCNMEKEAAMVSYNGMKGYLK